MQLAPTTKRKQQKCTHRNNYNSLKKCIFVAENKLVVEKYNPEIHKRRSVRLKDFDYSREGLYFITICCQNKAHFFGEIVNEKMVLNEIGQIIYNEWINTEKVRANVKLHTFVVMPNHFHAIVEIVYKIGENDAINVFKSPSQTLGAIVRGFKIATIKKIKDLYANSRGELQFARTEMQIIPKIWQRNYHEHIIRNEASYFKIHQYIENNPAKWEEDRFYS